MRCSCTFFMSSKKNLLIGQEKLICVIKLMYIDGLKVFMSNALTDSMAKFSNMNASEQWDYFKKKLSQDLEKFIPTTIVKSKVSHP